MKSSKYLTALCLMLFLAILAPVHGYPMTNLESNLVNKNEKQYPNGTVIGKYTYTDNEGTPIHVKYFADDTSYGVELKSVKVVNSKSDSVQPEKQSKLPLQLNDDAFELLMDPFAGFKDLSGSNKNLTFNPMQYRSDKTKETRKEDSKNNADYEIFSQNELKAPEKCGKEKVKIYFDKDKRKTRNTMKQQDSVEYCNRF